MEGGWFLCLQRDPGWGVREVKQKSMFDEDLLVLGWTWETRVPTVNWSKSAVQTLPDSLVSELRPKRIPRLDPNRIPCVLVTPN